MNKKVRSITYILAAAASAFALSGCSLVPSLNLTDEQNNLIAEYAAGKLIEYVKGHPGGLMTLEDVDRADVNPGMKKEEEVQPEPPVMPEENTEVLPPPEGAPEDAPAEMTEPSDDEEALVDAPADVSAEPTMTIAEALGIEGAVISYDHYETASSYPDNGIDLAFSMKAAEGKQLLITHFELSNPTDQDIEAHTASADFKVRLLLNGTDKIRGDITFLDNDLMNYRGLLTPGSSVDTVLVFEIPEGQEVSSMALMIVGNDGETQTYTIM